jgi:hypothetical protein
MTVEPEMDDPRDHFPIGMRVLAVDDDPTCLFFLETLLRRCQYHGLLLLFSHSFIFVYQFLDMGFWICALLLGFCF